MSVDGASSRIGRALAISPLRFPDFRVLCLASLLTGIGYVGETVVLGWLLLDKTDSSLIVGVGVALRALPNFLLGIPGGALVDRLDRRMVNRGVSVASGLNAGLLGALALSGEASVALILLFTFAGGCIRSLGSSARQSYAFDIVGPLQVIGGMSLMSLGQRIGGIAGSLGAGALLVSAGPGQAYAAIAACHVATAFVLLLARTRGGSAPVSRPPVLQGVREFTAELGNNRTLAILVLLTAAVEVLGFSFQAVLPSLARDTLGIDAEGLGLLNAIASVGGTASILTLSLGGELQRKGRFFLFVLLFFGAALVLLGASGSLAVALIAIALVSGLAALSDLLSQSLVQSAVPNDLRGRAMGSWVLAIGLGPVGHLQISGLAALFGVTAALATNGLLLMALAGAVLLTARQITRL